MTPPLLKSFVSPSFRFARSLAAGLVLIAVAFTGLAQELPPHSVIADDVPRTHQPFGGQPDEVKFIVVSDRTGAPQPGVFEDAIAKVNQLHPQFVMSVGDLIKGYTQDPAMLDTEWTEIDNILRTLDMPFFYVPGNHDTSNPWMEAQWRKRLGRPYYYFTYKNVLFLVLQTEDGGTRGITEQQAAYFRQVLAEHTDVRWTFVFMHRPLWLDEDDLGYDRIGEALEGRDYTLFSGHRHNYFFTLRGSAKHFVLATSGGGSPLRGNAYGEFHHVTQVTLTDGEPKIINVRLDGMLPEDLISDHDYPLIETLRKGTYFSIEPTVAAEVNTLHLETSLILTNPNTEALRVTADFAPPAPGWRFVPAALDETLPAGSTQSLTLRLEHTGEVAGASLADLPPLELTLTGHYDSKLGGITLPATRPWQIDWVRPLDEAPAETAVDGRIGHAADLAWIPFTPPGQKIEGWDWHGDEDLTGDFAVWTTPDALMFAGRFTDERWEFTRPDLSDQFWLYLQTTANGPVTEIHLAPQGAVSGPLDLVGAPAGSIAFARFAGQHLTLEMSIPKAALGLDRPGTELRFNLACMDHDRPAWEHPSILYWQPVWGEAMDFPRSGVFNPRSAN